MFDIDSEKVAKILVILGVALGAAILIYLIHMIAYQVANDFTKAFIEWSNQVAF